jgi:uncharacterized protein YjbI with pentapeptide repeats
VVAGTAITKLSVVANTLLSDLDLAGTKVTTLNVTRNRDLSSLDIRSTKITKLDLRGLDVSTVKARNAKVKIRATNPGAMARRWQTTIDAGVKVVA